MPFPTSPRPFRRRLLLVALLAALVGLTGCFTAETRIYVHRDGSGTVETIFSMSGPMLEMMAAFGEEESLCDEEDLLEEGAKMGEGVRLESFEPFEEDGRKGCRVLYAFDDINELRVDQSPSDEVSPEMDPDAPPPAEEFVTFNFTPGSPATLVMHIPQEAEAGDEEAMPDEEEDAFGEETAAADSTQLEQQKQMMRAMMEGMHIEMTVEVEGAISETNATYRDGSRITLMEVDFDKLLEDEENLDRLSETEPQSPAEMRALLENVEGIKVETSEQVRIRFE